MPVRPLVPAANRGPVRIDLDWDALEIAVERNSPDTDSYLDLTTGRVLTITSGDPEATLNRQQVSENIRNYLRVEPASSRDLQGAETRERCSACLGIHMSNDVQSESGLPRPQKFTGLEELQVIFAALECSHAENFRWRRSCLGHARRRGHTRGPANAC